MAINISHWLKVQFRWFKNYIFAKKCILINFGFSNNAFFSSHFIIVSYFTLWMLDFFNTIRHPGVKKFGSRSGPTFCRSWSGSKLFAKVISRHSGQRVKYKTTCWYFLAKTLAKVKFHLAPTFSTWLKCWLQQILSQGKPCMSPFYIRGSSHFPASILSRANTALFLAGGTGMHVPEWS